MPGGHTTPEVSLVLTSLGFGDRLYRLAIVLSLAACGGLALTAQSGCKPRPTDKENGAEVAAGPAQDYQTYVNELKQKVPVESESFKRSRYAADSYTVDDNYPTFFVEMVVRVEPVRLHDAVTGKTQTYTRARLGRDPSPAPGIVPLREAQRRAQEAALNARWSRVEMLP